MRMPATGAARVMASLPLPPVSVSTPVTMRLLVPLARKSWSLPARRSTSAPVRAPVTETLSASSPPVSRVKAPIASAFGVFWARVMTDRTGAPAPGRRWTAPCPGRMPVCL
jgi:hypothetical protein